MIEKLPISDQFIINCLKTDYAIEVATLTFLPLGADMNASVYKAQTHNQTSYFVKLKLGHHHDIGVEIAELLNDAGIKEIIPPVKTILGRSTQQIEDFTLIVHPFVKGLDGFSNNLTDNQWVKLGRALRQVHEIDVPSSIQNRARREVYSSKWREAVRSLYIHIETEPTGDEIALKLLKFIRENILRIRRLVDRAEQLGQKLQDQSHKFVLCHSDIHGGNVLLTDNDSISIVDWDDPIMAPKERDLMFIGGGVANVWNKSDEETLFYKGYGTTEVNSTLLAYYRHERIVKDIAEYGHALLLTTSGSEDRQEMYKHFIDMFEPNGVVDIAFKTDENLIAKEFSLILTPETSYEDECFKSVDAKETNLKKSAFSNVLFENCNFTESDWQQTDFSGCRFKNCNLSLVKLQGCRLQDIIFEECKMVGVDFYKCDKFIHIKFIKSILQICNFTDLKLKGISFSGSKVREVYFTNTDLQEADFSDADLLGTLFHQCNLTKSDFRNARNYSIDIQTNNLKKAKFSFPDAINLLKCLDIEITS